MNLSRRKFLWAAPAIVAAPSLMKIKPFEPILRPKVLEWGPFKFSDNLRADIMECFKDSMDTKIILYGNLSKTNWNGEFLGPNNQANATVQSFLVRA